MRAIRRRAAVVAACAGVVLAVASMPAAAQMFGAKVDSLRFPGGSTQLTAGQIDQLATTPAAVRRARLDGALAERADDLAAHALRGISEVELDEGAAAIDDLAPVNATTVPDAFTRSLLLQYRAEAMLEVKRAPEALVAADEAVALAGRDAVPADLRRGHGLASRAACARRDGDRRARRDALTRAAPGAVRTRS